MPAFKHSDNLYALSQAAAHARGPHHRVTIQSPLLIVLKMVLSTIFIQWATSLLFFKSLHKTPCFDVHKMKDLINRVAANLLRLWPVMLTDVF